jgi:predicted DNA-binding protein YlxM (UPF0122 family)
MQIKLNLRTLDYYNEHGMRETARHFNISGSGVYQRIVKARKFASEHGPRAVAVVKALPITDETSRTLSSIRALKTEVLDLRKENQTLRAFRNDINKELS